MQRKPTILIIDDDRLIRESMGYYLESKGFHVLQAEDGEKGLAVLQAEKPDIVLTDLWMPVLNGFEVIQRTAREFPETPIIVFSGGREIEDVIAAINKGAWDYIRKPVESFSDLTHIINKALEKLRLIQENKRYRENLEVAIEKRTQQLTVASEMLIQKVAALEIEVGKRKLSEQKLSEYQERLEELVRERTDELVRVNALLTFELEEHKQTEKELEQSHQRLHKALADLKQTQVQMLQAEKMASIGQLASGVAHEINNPIGFVRSNMETLNEYRLDLTRLLQYYQELETCLYDSRAQIQNTRIAAILKEIHGTKAEIDLAFIMDDYHKVIAESLEGIKRVIAIVGDLKDFAHSGQDLPCYADINESIRCTLNILNNELKYKADVSTDLGEIPMIRCYPQRINQVLMNILLNAAQAVETKGLITITTRTKQDQVEIRISDNGPGIPAHILPRIFDPFFTTKAVGKGTGLGLHLTYNIIQNHKGSIHVESPPGKGTAFVIRLWKDPKLEPDI